MVVCIAGGWGGVRLLNAEWERSLYEQETARLTLELESILEHLSEWSSDDYLEQVNWEINEYEERDFLDTVLLAKIRKRYYWIKRTKSKRLERFDKVLNEVVTFPLNSTSEEVIREHKRVRIALSEFEPVLGEGMVKTSD